MEHDLYNATLFPELETWEPVRDEALLYEESELLNAPVAARSVSFTLTPRDLDIIYSVGIYKYLSIFQLQRLHFPFAQSYRAASNRIGALVSAGLLSRVFYHQKLTAHTGRPASILYLQSENLTNLATYLTRKAKASLFDRFHDITTTNRDEFAYSFIMHELGISDLYLAFERSDRPHSLVFWERTSPKMEGVTDKLRAEIETEDGTRTHTLTFNPDSFLCYRTPDDSLAFYFHEHDNNTETNLHKPRQHILSTSAELIGS